MDSEGIPLYQTNEWTPNRIALDFDIYREELEVIYKYKSGGTIDDVKDMILDLLVKKGKKIDVIIIIAGGNDLDQEQPMGDPMKVAGRMKELVKELTTRPYPLVQLVTICQIIARESIR